MNLIFDPYITLGVSKDANVEEVKTAYRRIARRLHPDVNKNNPGATTQFQEATAAYEFLMDTQRRKVYDQQGVIRAANNAYAFSIQTTPSKSDIYAMAEQQVVYLLTQIMPDAVAKQRENQTQPRLNLTLILDHSNSMNGNRLDKVKVAAHQIIDQLTGEDIISVVIFNDRADVVIAATPVENKHNLKAKVSMVSASGGTEIFRGLSAGLDECRHYYSTKFVNHIILLTDGNTFGDQDRCMQLAQIASREGICISAMGLGQEWNDEFLDQLASVTGGASAYISSANAVVRFLNEHVRQLSNTFAERMRLSIAPDPDVKLDMAFKIAPNAQPVTVNDGYIQLGNLQADRMTSVLLQFRLPANLKIGFRSIARIVVYGDILSNQNQPFNAVSDIALEITQQSKPDDPPAVILEALSKLSLYRMQERAQEALERGDIQRATQQLETLATRLQEIGQEDLAHQALAEARHVAYTNNLSDKGRKTLKYQTRLLLAGKSEDKPE